MRLTTMASALAVLLLLALPAGADEENGFFVGLEARGLSPSGLPNDYALNDPDDDGTPEGTIEKVEFSSSASPRLWLGWQRDKGAWIFSYWGYDEDETDMVSAAGTAELWDILYHPNESFDDYQGSAMALSEVEATVIDLAYSRPTHQSDDLVVKWQLGLRSISMDHDLAVQYDDGFSIESVLLESEADGIGLSGGLDAMMQLGGKWSLMAGAQYSFMTGDIDSSTFMFDSGSGIGDPDVDVRTSEDRVFSVLDVSASIVWNPAERWFMWLGYEFSQWNNIIDTNLFPDDVNEGFVQTATSDVTWDGATFGVGVKF